jgi:hypothetical protein
VLLGWTGADGFPLVVPIKVGAADQRGIQLETPDGMVPPGGRRAGVTAHWFSRGVVGQRQTICTGWMEAEPAEKMVCYSPHRQTSYQMPTSRFVYRVATGGFTRLRYRRAPQDAKDEAQPR